MNICFIMYPWERVDPKFDSTLRIIHEAFIRDHNVGIITPSGLTIRDNEVCGFVKMICEMEKMPSSIEKFYKKVIFKEEMLPMSGFDVLFLRSNPPVDPTMLNFLDSLKGDILMINDIEGIRKANNKLYTASMFDKETDIIPRTHVSKNKNYLQRVIQESDSDKMILKPLDGYGGSGVIVLEKEASQSINSLLDFYINTDREQKYVILQEYIEGAHEGDVRILMLNGKPIGAMKRVPASGDLRSNVHAGGSVLKHSLSKAEKRICELVGPKLVADGLYFAGLDIINGKLIEINVLSPGGITRINKLNRTKLQQQIIDFTENIVHAKEAALNRKLASRMAIRKAKSL
ncbi:glutathione synthase [Leptobacterium flavescens]|uniref:Glutathione synthetase n=1 Tax=Leptobacterium flavescens TaxID=472055 RepID=A0A6P0UJX6_9FLAO|nr:glutathione synthase [Leptobacterium flavescens]NER13671.1 glutathione synthase [Leptobacterium flavescens]